MIDEGIIYFYFTQNESLIDKFNIKIVLIEEGFRCLFIKIWNILIMNHLIIYPTKNKIDIMYLKTGIMK